LSAGIKNTNTQWYVYMIKSSDGRLYTGVTTDVERRFSEHSGTPRGARFFRGRQPVEVVYTENHPDRSSAQRRESVIKKLTKAMKLDLIEQFVNKPPGRPC
jgi:putative endonuclease